jgi:hypothetical protein
LSLPHHLINKVIDLGEYLISLQRDPKQREMPLEENHSFGGISLFVEREDVDLIQITLRMKDDQRSRSRVTSSDRALSPGGEERMMFPPAKCTIYLHPDSHHQEDDALPVAVTTHYT